MIPHRSLYVQLHSSGILDTYVRKGDLLIIKLVASIFRESFQVANYRSVGGFTRGDFTYAMRGVDFIISLGRGLL